MEDAGLFMLRERKELNPHFPYECSNQRTHLTEEWSQSSRRAQRMSTGTGPASQIHRRMTRCLPSAATESDSYSML